MPWAGSKLLWRSARMTKLPLKTRNLISEQPARPVASVSLLAAREPEAGRVSTPRNWRTPTPRASTTSPRKTASASGRHVSKESETGFERLAVEAMRTSHSGGLPNSADGRIQRFSGVALRRQYLLPAAMHVRIRRNKTSTRITYSLGSGGSGESSRQPFIGTEEEEGFLVAQTALFRFRGGGPETVGPGGGRIEGRSAQGVVPGADSLLRDRARRTRR